MLFTRLHLCGCPLVLTQNIGPGAVGTDSQSLSSGVYMSRLSEDKRYKKKVPRVSVMESLPTINFLVYRILC